jgi:hypothetical protein
MATGKMNTNIFGSRDYHLEPHGFPQYHQPSYILESKHKLSRGHNPRVSYPEALLTLSLNMKILCLPGAYGSSDVGSIITYSTSPVITGADSHIEVSGAVG